MEEEAGSMEETQMEGRKMERASPSPQPPPTLWSWPGLPIGQTYAGTSVQGHENVFRE